MTPRQENELLILVGRMSGQIEAMKETLDSLVVKAEQTAEFRHEVTDRLDSMDQHNINMGKVAAAFQALQTSIHEGAIRVSAGSKGFMIGVGVAAGGTGAAVTTFIKWVYTTVTGGG